MQIKLPFRNNENKADVNLSIVSNNTSLSEDEKESLNHVANIFTGGTIEYIGKFQTVFVSIRKESDCLIIQINGNRQPKIAKMNPRQETKFPPRIF